MASKPRYTAQIAVAHAKRTSHLVVHAMPGLADCVVLDFVFEGAMSCKGTKRRDDCGCEQTWTRTGQRVIPQRRRPRRGRLRAHRTISRRVGLASCFADDSDARHLLSATGSSLPCSLICFTRTTAGLGPHLRVGHRRRNQSVAVYHDWPIPRLALIIVVDWIACQQECLHNMSPSSEADYRDFPLLFIWRGAFPRLVSACSKSRTG